MTNRTLRQLRYFEALAQHGHFGRAAEAAAVSWPALSVQIKELEATLGVALIDRGGRGVRLTRFGTEFRQQARDILRGVNELDDLARAAGQGMAGRLRFGVIPTFAFYMLPRLVTGVSRRFDQLDLRSREPDL